MQDLSYTVDPNQNSASTTITDLPIDASADISQVIFGTVEADTIEVNGENQIILSGDLNDLIDASIGSEGGNRIYAGDSDDTLILGESDRIIGGEGDDLLFATSSGGNTISGNLGADQFWIASAEIPDSVNIITDFTLDEDILGISGLGIGFDDLTISQTDASTLIAVNGSDLALLTDITPDSLNSDNFAFG